VPYFPFTSDIAGLLSDWGKVPIDETVPFAEEFQQVMTAHGGNPWGPQASAQSKLATVLHFAGWNRQQLEDVELKPKDVENFRRKHGMIARRIGRPKAKPEDSNKTDAVASLRDLSPEELLAALKTRRDNLQTELTTQMAAVQDLQDKLTRLSAGIDAMEI
jgi:hypothetical protein